MMKRRIVGVMITLLALSAIFAATVSAAGENAGLLADSNAGQVYFGNKADGVTPALYRVAAIDANQVTLLYNNEDIGAGPVKFKDALPLDWVSSNVCTFLNGDTFLTKTGVFTNTERNAISNYGTTEVTTIGTIDISQKIGIPSQTEIESFHMAANADSYWLRTFDTMGILIGTMSSGNVVLEIPQSTFSIRPIMKLDQSKILYSTPAVGGKAGDGCYVPVNPSTGVKKLTLIDSSLHLLSVKARKQLSTNEFTMIHYSGATPGKTLAALIVRKSDGAVLSRLKTSQVETDSGGFGLLLPSDFNSAEQTLKFVVETVNGDYQTDYASLPVDFTLMTFDERMTTYGSGSKITLTEDETFSNPVSIENKDITIDLAGKKLTYNGAGYAFQVNGTANLKIIDSIGGGSINSNNDGIHVSQTASFTLESGTISGTTSVLGENNATLTISGGIVTGETALTVGVGITTVRGGIINGKTSIGADGVLYIDGGMLGAIENSGSVKITGGSVVSVSGAKNEGNEPLIRYQLHLGESGVKLLSISTVPTLGYDYHTTDAVTNADGEVFVWLPARITKVSAETADGIFSGKAVADGDGFVVTLLRDSSVITAEKYNARKSAADSKSVSFQLVNPVSGDYKVYDSETNEIVLVGVTATLNGSILTLSAKEGALAAGTYHIALTEPNHNEGTRTAFLVSEAPVKPVYTKNVVSSYLYYQGNSSVTPLTVTAAVTDGGIVTYEWFQNTVKDTVGAVSLGITGDSYTPSAQSIGTKYYFVVAMNTLDGIMTSAVSDYTMFTVRKQEDLIFIPITKKYTITATAANSSLFGNLESVSVTGNAATAFGNNATVVIGDFKGMSTTFLRYVEDNLRVTPFTLSFYIKSTSTTIALKNAASISLTLPLPKELVSKKDSLKLIVDTAGTPTEVAKTLSESNGVTYITFTVKSAGTYAFVTENAWVNPFTDVKTTDSFFNAVRFVSERGLMIGTATTLFSPDTSISRGMISTILYRLAGVKEQGPSGFSDVPLDAYYANAVYWAEKQGLVNGYGNGKFGPNDNITREQLITILWRNAGKPVVSEDTLVGFNDWEAISTYANPAIAWAMKVGIVTEKSGEFFNPKKIATRAQTAEWLYRYVAIDQS